VQLLQLGLTRASYPPRGGTDGVFGPGTRDALLRFQMGNQLRADAIAGPKTYAALRPWLTGYTTVTVKPGDTMYKLARRFSADLAAVMAANPGADPLNLRIGSKLAVPLPFDVVPEDIALTSELLSLCIKGLAARYPFMETSSAGRSVMGRELSVVSIGKGQKSLFLNAAHHANEWITGLFALRFVENYLKAVVSGGDIEAYDAASLYSAVRFACLPLVNPDGTDLVTGFIAPGSAQYEDALAMNYPPVAFPSGWKANIEGTDLNLQYPAGWEKAREIKFAQGYTRPGPRDYVGPAPLTAPESLAVYELTKASDFLMTLSYHTAGEVIYWKYDGFEPPRSREIGEKLSAASGYPLETTPYGSGYAGYKDWFIQSYDRPGYTVEAGSGTSPLPLSQFRSLYAANAPLVAAALDIVSKA
jgi:g-D-glutamyl-meso-diaminopimelate peptidase